MVDKKKEIQSLYDELHELQIEHSKIRERDEVISQHFNQLYERIKKAEEVPTLRDEGKQLQTRLYYDDYDKFCNAFYALSLRNGYGAKLGPSNILRMGALFITDNMDNIDWEPYWKAEQPHLGNKKRTRKKNSSDKGQLTL